MKKYAYLALCLVLTAAMMVGCGCTNRESENTSAPTVLPTNEEVWDTTEPTTRATTEPSSEPSTAPSVSPSDAATVPSETADRGNGPLEDTTASTDAPMENRSRSIMPGSAR